MIPKLMCVLFMSTIVLAPAQAGLLSDVKSTVMAPITYVKQMRHYDFGKFDRNVLKIALSLPIGLSACHDTVKYSKHLMDVLIFLVYNFSQLGSADKRVVAELIGIFGGDAVASGLIAYICYRISKSGLVNLQELAKEVHSKNNQ